MSSTCGNLPFGGPASDPIVVPEEQTQPGKKMSVADVRWPKGSTLVVGFLNGNDSWNKKVKDQVKAIAPKWSEFANIKFNFINEPSDDININFEPSTYTPYGTYSSYLGTDSAKFARAGQASMNLVFKPNVADDREFNRVILHEFGHALGAIHEHMRPDRPIHWDVDAVVKYYTQLTGGKWDRKVIEQQVINPFKQRLAGSSDFDPLSIMMYPFPPGLAKFDDGTSFHTDWNTELTQVDKDFIGEMYPF